MTAALETLISGVRSGDRRALARLMTLVEREVDGVGQALSALHDRLGRAHVIGITGPPGGGKSTLILHLTKESRLRDRQVGVIAVDPTSPLTGGSVLGDRIRLQELHSDPRVFIRSMASGGVGGGLASRTLEMVDLLDAFGFDPVFVETVGVGQGETDISRIADTNVVVVVPGLGDDIQALKAGVLETADIFVVNKSDRPEAQATVATLRAMLEIGEPRDWSPPVLATSSLTGEGVAAVVDTIDQHRAYLHSANEGEHRRGQRNLERVRVIATRQLMLALEDEIQAGAGARGQPANVAVDLLLQRVAERVRRGSHS